MRRYHRLLLLVLLLAPSSPGRAMPDTAKLELQEGDRILLLGNTFLERDRHYGHIETMLRSRFPGLRLSVRNMAWPGDTTTVQLRPLNFGSMEKHIAIYKPSVIFVSFGLNESFEGPDGLDGYLEGYRGILDKLGETKARIVILSPLRHENLGPPLPDPAEHNRSLELYAEATRKLSAERGHPFIDLFSALTAPSDGSESQPLTENGIHLSSYGYWRAVETIARGLGLGQNRWRIELTVGVKAIGARVARVRAAASALRFKATDLLLPIPAPEGSPPGSDRQAAQRVLKVEGLDAGRYTLRVDGHRVASASAQEWARGVALTEHPSFEQARKLRDEIVRKDRLFFNRWRAHNGEYIYGRRSKTDENHDPKTGKGNAGNPTFPAELAEFDRLLKLADEKINKLSRPKTYVYELLGEPRPPP